jgi:hypothetical protein
MNPQAYPLTWPIRQPRTKSRTESRFKKPHQNSRPGNYMAHRRHTIDEARRCLSDELERLGGSHPVLSTNLILRLDGQPKSGQSQPLDPGVAVYFEYMGKPHVLACDKWQHVECNIYAIAKHIEAMRGMDRWGVGTTEQAFTGYLALEAQTQPKWFEYLECKWDDLPSVVEESRRRLIRKYHPDGTAPDAEKFHQVGEAYRIYKEMHP